MYVLSSLPKLEIAAASKVLFEKVAAKHKAEIIEDEVHGTPSVSLGEVTATGGKVDMIVHLFDNTKLAVELVNGEGDGIDMTEQHDNMGSFMQDWTALGADRRISDESASPVTDFARDFFEAAIGDDVEGVTAALLEVAAPKKLMSLKEFLISTKKLAVAAGVPLRQLNSDGITTLVFSVTEEPRQVKVVMNLRKQDFWPDGMSWTLLAFEEGQKKQNSTFSLMSTKAMQNHLTSNGVKRINPFRALSTKLFRILKAQADIVQDMKDAGKLTAPAVEETKVAIAKAKPTVTAAMSVGEARRTFVDLAKKYKCSKPKEDGWEVITADLPGTVMSEEGELTITVFVNGINFGANFLDESLDDVIVTQALKNYKEFEKTLKRQASNAGVQPAKYATVLKMAAEFFKAVEGKETSSVPVKKPVTAAGDGLGTPLRRPPVRKDSYGVPIIKVLPTIRSAYARAQIGNNVAKLRFAHILWDYLNDYRFDGILEEPGLKMMRSYKDEKESPMTLWLPRNHIISMAPELFFQSLDVFVEAFLREMCRQAAQEVDGVMRPAQLIRGREWRGWMLSVGLDPRRFVTNKRTIAGQFHNLDMYDDVKPLYNPAANTRSEKRKPAPVTSAQSKQTRSKFKLLEGVRFRISVQFSNKQATTKIKDIVAKSYLVPNAIVSNVRFTEDRRWLADIKIPEASVMKFVEGHVPLNRRDEFMVKHGIMDTRPKLPARLMTFTTFDAWEKACNQHYLEVVFDNAERTASAYLTAPKKLRGDQVGIFVEIGDEGKGKGWLFPSADAFDKYDFQNG